ALAGGYTFYWHKKADEFSAALAQSIIALNDQARGYTKDTPLLRYEAITTTGFPFSMGLTIIKPVVALPVSAYLKTLPQTPSGIARPAAIDWVEEVGYGESVSVSSTRRADRFTFVMAGDRTHASLVNQKPFHALVSHSSAPLVCHLNMARKSYLPWDIRPLF